MSDPISWDSLFSLDQQSTAPFQQWKSGVVQKLSLFLCSVKEQVIEKYSLKTFNVVLSFHPEPGDSTLKIEKVNNILQVCLIASGCTVTIDPLSSADSLKTQLHSHDLAIVLCTPSYAKKVQDEPEIHAVIDEFGKSKSDSLLTLLCAGGFGDTALKIVDGHFLIRDFKGFLIETEESLAPLETLIDVILNFSGSQGLGLIPDFLDLEKKQNINAYKTYKDLYYELDESRQEFTRTFILKKSVEKSIQENPLRSHLKLGEGLPSALDCITELQNLLASGDSVLKTIVFFCPRTSETILTGLALESLFNNSKYHVLSLNCSQYKGKAAHQCVALALQGLKMKANDVEELKQSEIIILLKNYEQLGSFDNLVVRNRLNQWPQLKVIFTCRNDLFNNRDYKSCFLSDPANPRPETLKVFRVKPFATEEAEKDFAQVVETNVKSGNSNTGDQNQSDQEIPLVKSKVRAQRYELSNFLQKVKSAYVAKGVLQANTHENPQLFISYAWEGDKKSLIRQQMHLSRMVQDLGSFGVPGWLDIEKMTGDIDQQMAGNIRDSKFTIVIGTPRYTQRSQAETNVKKEYLAILEKQATGNLIVIPVRFSDDNPQFSALVPEFKEHSNLLDFRQIDNGEFYIQQFVSVSNPEGVIPKILKGLSGTNELDLAPFQQLYDHLKKQLEILPAKHLVVDKGSDYVLDLDIENRLRSYIKPYALNGIHDALETRFDLEDAFANFLRDNEEKSLIVLGGAGSGKSLFTLSSFYNSLQKWIHWKEESQAEAVGQPPEWLPIYISLKNYSKEGRWQNCIDLALKDEYELDDTDIKQLKEGLGRNQKILFILDGFDELGKGVRPNYPEKLVDWKNAKLLISGRPDHFDKESELMEAFSVKNSLQSYRLLYLSPFTKSEIEQYVNNFEQQTEQAGTLDKLKSIPGLLPLLDNPFLLNLVLQALPQLLLSQNSKLKNSNSPIQKADIYKAFVETIFIKEAFKQKEINNHDIELIDCHNFAQDLAFELFKSKTIVASPSNTKLWLAFFADLQQQPLREACPLKRTGNEYTYIHKSVFEYFVATKLWNNLSDDVETIKKYWGERSLSEEIAVLEFLGQFCQAGRPFSPTSNEEESSNPAQAEGQLLKLVEQSKTDASYWQVAANAISTLNFAETSFIRKDFSGVRIKGADLRNAVCDYANFEGADLSLVQFSNASLSFANLQKAQLQGVEFGEFPFLSFDDTLNSCCFSPDGLFLAIAVADEVHLYRTKPNYMLHHVLADHEDKVTWVSFSPTKHVLASCSKDKTIKIWDIDSGEELNSLEEHTDKVNCVCFSPDGKLLASGSLDNTICFWDLELNELRMTCRGHTKQVNCLAFSGDGRQLVSGSDDCSVRIWEVESGALLQTLEKHTSSVHSVAFHPNNVLVASGGDDTATILWTIEQGEVKKQYTSEQPIRTVAFSPNGLVLASAGEDSKIRLWGVDLGELQATFSGHTSDVISISFFPTGEMLASAGKDLTLRFWQVPKGRSQKRDAGLVYDINFHPKDPIFATICAPNQVSFWNIEDGRIQTSFETLSSVYSLSFSPDGDKLLIGAEDSVQFTNIGGTEILNTLTGHSDSVWKVKFSPDKKLLASASLDGNANIYDFETKEIKFSLTEHTQGVATLDFNPQGTILATGCQDGDVKLWQIDSGEVLATFEDHQEEVSCVNFNPDGKLLATASKDGKIGIWDVETKALVKFVEGHDDHVYSVVWCPHPDYPGLFASGSLDQTLRLWHLETGLLQVIEINAGIISLEWNASTPLTLVSGHDDGSVRAWRLIKSDDKAQFDLLWRSASVNLVLSKANIEGAEGLSLINAKLLEQRGVVGKPQMLGSLTKDAEKGDPNAQVELGKFFLSGEAGTVDFKQAVSWFQKAADQQHPEGQFLLGRCHQKGQGFEKADPPRAFELYQLSAKGGSVEGQTALAKCFLNGDLTTKDLNSAVEWLYKAAQAKGVEAQFYLAECFRKGEGVEKNFRDAYAWYAKAAESKFQQAVQTIKDVPEDFKEGGAFYAALNGDVSAYYDVGRCFFDEDEEFDEAVKYWKLGAEKGDLKSQNSLGECYRDGTGVEQNIQKAIELWNLAQTIPEAKFNLSECYRTGTGLEKNEAKALELLNEAVQAGVDAAKVALGLRYRDGNGVTQDLGKAYDLFYDAGMKGDLDAKYYLALCYHHGYGVGKSLRQAVSWLISADDEGTDLQNAQVRTELEALGAPSDFEEAMEWCVEQGDAEAQARKGLRLWKDKDEPDLEEAFKCFYLSAQKGNPFGQTMVGVFYLHGISVPQNFQKARKFLRKASSAPKHNRYARFILGTIHQNGQGLEKPNPELAQKYFDLFVSTADEADDDEDSFDSLLFIMTSQGTKGWQMALKKEIPAFLYHEGFRCENGVGIAEDYQGALEWYKKAAETDDILALVALGKDDETDEDFASAAENYVEAVKGGSVEALERLKALKESGKIGAEVEIPALPEMKEPSFVDPEDDVADTSEEIVPEVKETEEPSSDE